MGADRLLLARVRRVWHSGGSGVPEEEAARRVGARPVPSVGRAQLVDVGTTYSTMARAIAIDYRVRMAPLALPPARHQAQEYSLRGSSSSCSWSLAGSIVARPRPVRKNSAEAVRVATIRVATMEHMRGPLAVVNRGQRVLSGERVVRKRVTFGEPFLSASYGDRSRPSADKRQTHASRQRSAEPCGFGSVRTDESGRYPSLIRS